ncbi:MAG TPA: hypothetical protein VHK69_19575 [Chitinophagaceae bacterium]|jgi:hypothetical protein|nr:hypothetical protein [Chitinophagaceae bacterium]
MMDPEVKRYFRKIINSFSWGLIWLLAMAMIGLYYRLALFPDGFSWRNGLFYALFLGSFCLLLRYYYRTWKEPYRGEL